MEGGAERTGSLPHSWPVVLGGKYLLLEGAALPSLWHSPRRAAIMVSRGRITIIFFRRVVSYF